MIDVKWECLFHWIELDPGKHTQTISGAELSKKYWSQYKGLLCAGHIKVYFPVKILRIGFDIYHGPRQLIYRNIK